MTIKTQEPWPLYGLKNCMVLTGRPLVEGGKIDPDPHTMACADDSRNSSEYKFEMPHMIVDLDDKAQAEFSEAAKKWAIPVTCTKSSDTNFQCKANDR